MQIPKCHFIHLYICFSMHEHNSGRSEKQAAKDALSIGRTPPAFTRVPSKRQPRRVMDDFLNGVGKSSTLLTGSSKNILTT